ncbi:Ran binding protein zinc finger-like protein [Dioscorea alata]|uniref:Ran binding protein zinc finger-like protein n=2 Tax=Dioscorea alata TaxID=55571 RepID=A0ACB7TUC9_DIOAL|nr:Ran binding protein zinc finger-like protein [Dioscorea alata]KAH7652152.1 Ran binding protein zinc finger-like protein [Dioscorea alata]
MNRYPGDWDCRACQHLNFSRRDTCQRCGEAKIGGGGGRVNGSKSSDAKPGDWYCMCGTHNFASRPNCFTCGTYKTGCVVAAGAFDGYGYTGVPTGWKSGDWICTMPGCNEHNYASRKECFRCNTPRDYYMN